MHLGLDQIMEAYHASFHNRNIINRQAKISEQGLKFKVISLLYNLLLLVKVFIALFQKRLNSKERIFVSWSPLHSKLAKKIGEENVIEIKMGLHDDQTALYKSVSVVKAFQAARLVTTMNSKREITGFDNFFFAFAFGLESQMIFNLIRNSRNVLMAGQVDRFSILLSVLCRDMGKHFTFVQHGVNNQFDNLYKLRVDEIYYLFEISIPFFGCFVLEADKQIYKPIPQVKPNFEVCDTYENAIAFASQFMVEDLRILDVLIEHWKHGDILIYPHPTEKNLDYFRKYTAVSNVHITSKRIKNIKYIFSSGSTLGMEYDLIGVVPVFINLHKISSEIFLSQKYICFNDIDSFQEWFVSEAKK
ncbi:MAG: hypothetical protein RH948_09360 [Cyclobacteriaceae bacterium]